MGSVLMAELTYITGTWEKEVKWGEIPSMGTADSNLDVWNLAIEVPDYQFIPYNIDSDGAPIPGGEILYASSTNAGDAGKLIEIKGLEALTGRLVLVRDTLDATNATTKKQFGANITKVNGLDLAPADYFDFQFFRAFRGSLEDQISDPDIERADYPKMLGDFYLYRDTTNTTIPGKPDVVTRTQVYIKAGENQSQMLIYTIPFDAKEVLLKRVKVSLFKQNATAGQFVLWLRSPYGGLKKFPVIGAHSQGDNPELTFDVAELGPGNDIFAKCSAVTTNDTGISGLFEIHVRLV